jgi:hypothetical protein
MEGKTYDANRLLYLDVTCNMSTTSRNKNGVTRPSSRYMEIRHKILYSNENSERERERGTDLAAETAASRFG